MTGRQRGLLVRPETGVQLATEVIVGSRETLVILAKKAWMEREESLDSKGYLDIRDHPADQGQKDPKASRVRKESQGCGAPPAAEAHRVLSGHLVPEEWLEGKGKRAPLELMGCLGEMVALG
ncbi:UNVERIFIED_CONTAM: hypothetical protein K2H54_046898 [Gekko kuhli]